MSKIITEVVKNNLNLFDNVQVTMYDRTIDGIISDMEFAKRLSIEGDIKTISFIPIYYVSTLVGVVRCKEEVNESGTISLVYIDKVEK